MSAKPFGDIPIIPTEHGRQMQYEAIPFRDELFPIRMLWNLRTRSHSPSDTILPSWHEQLEILYITEGCLLCECDFRSYECREGDIVIVNPYEAHVVKHQYDTARYHCLMVDPRLYGGREDISGIKYIQPMSERRVRFRHVIRQNERARQILLELLEEYRRADPGYEMAVKGHLLCLLAELFRNEIEADDSRHPDTKQASIAPALRHIATHYAAEITLDDLAGACCMNRSYFCRRFRAITGQTAIAYVNGYRLTKAHALLLTTELTVSEIALATGFSDSNYLTRVFHRYYGTSPRDLRRTLQYPKEEA